MSEKPNPSLDCASLVRFSALPLYHSTELQSCWAVIRSPSLLQTPPLRPMFSHLSFPITATVTTTTHPPAIKKDVYILHIPAHPWSLRQPLSGFALKKSEK